MITFIVHDAAGNILRNVSCSLEMSLLQAGEGEFLLEGIADDATQMVNVTTGLLVDKPVDTVALQQEFQDELRIVRDRMLTTCDWTQLVDAPLAAGSKADFGVYRQALRDLPASYTTETDLSSVTFPAPPTI
jgi:hypothetical protein